MNKIIKRFVEAFLEVSGLRVEAQANEAAAEKAAQAAKENAAREKYAAAMARVNDLAGKEFAIYDYDRGGFRLSEKEEQIKVLASFRKMVANDIATATSAQFLYEDVSKCVAPTLLPYLYDTDEKQDETLPYSKDEENLVVDNTTITPLVTPGMMDRFGGHIVRKSDIAAEKMLLSDLPKYYKNFGVVTPGGNRHKVADAFINRNCGTIRVRVIDDSPLFENLETDGAWWYATKTGRKTQKVADWRVAVVFSIRKMEMALEKEVNK